MDGGGGQGTKHRFRLGAVGRKEVAVYFTCTYISTTR